MIAKYSRCGIFAQIFETAWRKGRAPVPEYGTRQEVLSVKTAGYVFGIQRSCGASCETCYENVVLYVKSAGKREKLTEEF